MIFATPFRRTCFEHEGGAPRPAGGVLALACHKGDASSSVTNEQAGAQSGGVTLSDVTINQKSGVSGSGSSGGVSLNRHGQIIYDSPAAPGAPGGDQSITINTDTHAVQAIAALQAAVDAAGKTNQTTADLATAAVNAIKENNAALDQTTNALSKVGSIASIAGGAFLAYKLFFHKKS